VLIREDDAFHPEGAKKNYTRIRGEKKKIRNWMELKILMEEKIWKII
jgi:hypothetical protein